jgi:hypothetical protein
VSCTDPLGADLVKPLTTLFDVIRVVSESVDGRLGSGRGY